MEKVNLVTGLDYEKIQQSYAVLREQIGDALPDIDAYIYLGPFDFAKQKRPNAHLNIPWEFSAMMGWVIAQWGSFEVLFDRLIACMLFFTKDEPEHDWRRINFRKRRALFKEQVKKCFSAHQEIMAYLNRVSDDAGEAYWKRNMLAHGQIDFIIEFAPPSGIGTRAKAFSMLIIRGRHNGRGVDLTYSYKDLESLFYDITHLHVRLYFLEDELHIDNPMLSSIDKSLLRDFWLTNRQNPPSETTPLSQPVASQG